MRKAIFFCSLLTIASLGAACGGPATNNAVTNSGNAANTGNSKTLAVQTPTPAAVTNNAPTLTPVFKAFCEAVNKKDEAAIRKIYAAETMKDIEKQMKEGGYKSLSAYLEDDKYNKICEVQNEEISGDTAWAVIKGDSYPNGIRVQFVKENGEWKLTTKSDAISSMKPSTASNANAAK
jgi:hypothetical protein